MKVAIIGGGLAGLSAAVELADKGVEVVVIEKSATLGGRAGNIIDEVTYSPIPLGPHVILSSYDYFLSFLDRIGVKNEIKWQEEEFTDMVCRGEHHVIRGTKFPRILYLMKWIFNYKFISFRDAYSNIRFVSIALLWTKKRIEGFDDLTADTFLRQHGVTESCINNLWRFWALSMLNVPLERCSAAALTLLLRKWLLFKCPKVSHPIGGLGDLFVHHARRYIEQRGGSVLCDTTVTDIVFEDGKIQQLLVQREGTTQEVVAHAYLSTLDPVSLRRLLCETSVGHTEFFGHLEAFEGVPYISVFLWFNWRITEKKWWVILDKNPVREYCNSDFYNLSPYLSLIASNMVYSHAYHGMSDADVVRCTREAIEEAFPDARFAHNGHSRVHRLPYVIYAPYPGTRKHILPHKTPIANFYLAGDWTVKDLPQSMEAAVKSGVLCVQEILKR